MNMYIYIYKENNFVTVSKTFRKSLHQKTWRQLSSMRISTPFIDIVVKK